MTLNKDIFRALAAVAWADGAMAPSEADALLRAARAAGLSASELVEVETTTRQAMRLEALGPLSLTEEEAEYTFALACMVSAVDGRVDAEERACIRELGDRLRLSEDARTRAAGASVAVGQALGLETSVLDALTRALGGA